MVETPNKISGLEVISSAHSFAIPDGTSCEAGTRIEAEAGKPATAFQCPALAPHIGTMRQTNLQKLQITPFARHLHQLRSGYAMKLFLVIYSAAHIGGAIGPLPYGMDGCERHRDEMRAKLEAFLADGIDRKTGQPASPKRIEEARSLRFECEYRDSRPVLGEPA